MESETNNSHPGAADLERLLKLAANETALCLGGSACEFTAGFETYLDPRKARLRQHLSAEEIGVTTYWQKYGNNRALVLRIRPPKPTFPR